MVGTMMNRWILRVSAGGGPRKVGSGHPAVAGRSAATSGAAPRCSAERPGGHGSASNSTVDSWLIMINDGTVIHG